jgi:fructose-1,6-bisphosphatase/inositol monophosphatase family enzyme
MMVALVQNNTPVMSWIHDPLSGRIVSAEAGAGAWLANERLSIPSAPKDQDMIGLLNFWYFKEPDRSRIKKQAAKQFKKIDSLSCAGHDFWAQAEGRRHFSFYRRLWPWDHIPGTLLMREAGGVVGQINGMSYRAGERLHGLLSAPDQETWLRIEDFLLHGQG